MPGVWLAKLHLLTSGLNIDKIGESPTRKMDTAHPKKPGGRVISRAVECTTAT
jgi:hypothetical protein